MNQTPYCIMTNCKIITILHSVYVSSSKAAQPVFGCQGCARRGSPRVPGRGSSTQLLGLREPSRGVKPPYLALSLVSRTHTAAWWDLSPCPLGRDAGASWGGSARQTRLHLLSGEQLPPPELPAHYSRYHPTASSEPESGY